MSSPQYLNFIEQTLHYFDRPHQQVVTSPVACAAAWQGRDMPALEQLAYELNDEEVQELREAVATATSLGRETRDLTAGDFPLPLLEKKMPEWR